MKLIFPNGEHAPATLEEGVASVGTASDCVIVLAAPGVAAHHAEIETRAGQSVVRPLDASAPTVLNGRQITQETPLKPGDLVLFARVGCRVSSDRPVAATAPPPSARKSADEAARTRVRNTLPKYMLRGVSGASRSFRRGDLLWLANVPLRGLRNPGSEPAVLLAIARANTLAV